MDIDRFRTHSLQDPRVLRILAAALDAVEPGRIVREHLAKAILPQHKRVFLLGIGKASEAMTSAAAEFFDYFTDSLVITKHASNPAPNLLRVTESGHPIPDARSLAAGRAAMEFVSQVEKDDLLVCLISGGGSALMTLPQDGLTLEDMQSLTGILLRHGASINEINILRRALDRVKGGGLARATKGHVLSLTLSDVIGNPLEIIASGPTVQTRYQNDEAISIAKKYFDMSMPEIYKALTLHQTPIDETVEGRVQNIIIGDIHTAANAARTQALQEGFRTEILELNIHGEASEVGIQMAAFLKKVAEEKPHPFCIIAGGETTVTIRGNGKGGRNQELALAAANELKDVQNVMFITLATDGDDGPTDAAGAVVNSETFQRGAKLGMAAADYLSGNDAYNYFEPLNDLLKPGYTGTNVNDLIFLIGF